MAKSSNIVTVQTVARAQCVYDVMNALLRFKSTLEGVKVPNNYDNKDLNEAILNHSFNETSVLLNKLSEIIKNEQEILGSQVRLFYKGKQNDQENSDVVQQSE